jgi:hypothetical protein
MTMADLDTMIAQGPPRLDFSPLSTLFDSYDKGRKAGREEDIWTARKQAAVIRADGRPDFGATTANLLRAGDVAGARQVAAMMKDARWGVVDAATDNTTDGAPETPAWPKIPMAAANALKFEPWRSNEFDAKFGPGMSALVMRWGNNG